MDSIMQDIRYAIRRLLGSPGFTATTVSIVALGIGASTAIFSAVNPILLEPLPYPHADRLLIISYAGVGGARAMQSFGTYREIATRSRSFEAIAVFRTWQPTITGAAEPERLDGQRVSASYFRALGVKPALGALFDSADDRLNGPDLVMLSDALWRRRFGADPSIVGRQIPLDGRSFTVVAVMPRGFENVVAPSADVWSLLQYDASLPPQSREWGHHLQMIGRLLPTVDANQARRELDQIARTPFAEFPRQPGSFLDRGLIVDTLRDDLTRGTRPVLLAVVSAVLLLLTIASVNVASLLLARGAQRRGEFAIRTALGATRSRVIRQVLTESLLLAMAGGALGLAVAQIGVDALVALAPPGMPRLGAIGVNRTTFVFAAVVSTLVGVVVGLLPALNLSRGDLRAGLEHASRRSAAGHTAARGTLVVAEVALAVVLLVCAGLLLRSLERLFSIPPGFEASHLLTMQVQVSSVQGSRDDSAYRRFFERALEATRQTPGVTAAALTSELPLSGEDATLDVYRGHVDRPADAPVQDVDGFRYAVTPGYFQTMGIPLRRGRWLDQRDEAAAPVRPVLISESFAKRAFAGQNPVGQRIRFGGREGRPWDEIVGVVGDVKQTSLAATETNAFYVATAQWLWVDNPMWLVVRTRGDPAALAPAIRQAIWSVDRDQPIVRVAAMDALVAASEAERRFALTIFEAFGLVALVLATTGLYGLLSGRVSERVREIGVRSALGASRGEILSLVVRQGMTFALLGLVVGLATAFIASRAVVALLFGVSRLDPATYAGVIGLLTLGSALACLVPAWRATKIDPMVALRYE
jgi:putative ABC transport system permease protein